MNRFVRACLALMITASPMFAQIHFGAKLFAVILAVSLRVISSAHAQSTSAAQIVFLHFKIKDDTIALVKSNTRPGVVKQRRGGETHGGIYYDVVSSSGQSLWHGVMDDPLVQRMEYGDPTNPGQLNIKYVKLKEAEFRLRMPFKPEAHRIEFYRVEPPIDQNRRKILRRPLGSILLQMKGGEAK